jgi:hypothetical protein
MKEALTFVGGMAVIEGAAWVVCEGTWRVGMAILRRRWAKQEAGE